MAATRKYYEKLLDYFDAICKLKEAEIEKLEELKQKLLITLNEVDKYYLFDISVPDDFETRLKIRSEFLEDDRDYFAKALYIFLGELLFNFENVDRQVDYSKALEISRTELPFESVSKWQIAQVENSEFSMERLFFQLNSKNLKISKVDDYIEYKTALRSHNSQIRKKESELPISAKKVREIQEWFESQIKEYEEFIETHYIEIAEEFAAFRADIRIYIIPHYYPSGDILKTVKVYKPTVKPSIKVYPFYLDFVARFKNAEEIEGKPIYGYEGLFNETNIKKYGSFFSVRRVFYEIHSIFISNASFDDLKAYLLFLLR